MSIPIITGEADQLLSLLKLLADPKHVEHILKQITTRQKELEKTEEDARKQTDDAKATMNKIGQAQADLIRREKALTDERAQFVQIQRNLQQQKDELSKKSAALGEQISNAGRLEADAQLRNAQSLAREARVAKREEELKKSVDEHRAWLESIKPPR